MSDEQQRDEPQAGAAANGIADATPPAEADELAKAKTLADEYLAGWKRATADYANLQKETQRGRDDFAKYAAVGVVTKLLPLMDSFRKAMAQQPDVGDDAESVATKQWMDGIGHIRSQFESAMASAGVAAIDQVNVPFDPAAHEAMMIEKHPDAASGSVIKVLEAGYRMHDRIIRPAKVVVAE